jgi:hypothetical protein
MGYVILIIAAVIVIAIVVGMVAVLAMMNTSAQAAESKAKQEREDRDREDSNKRATDAAQKLADKESSKSGTVSTPVADPWMYIKAADQGHCLQAEAVKGGHIISSKCSNKDSQKWSFDPLNKRIKSKTGFCMSTGGDYHSLQDCNSSEPLQGFTYDDQANRIASTATTECLANRKGAWSWDWICDKANDHDQYVSFSTTIS